MRETKSDADQIREELTRRGLKRLYHFTDERNLPSIVKEKGILCRRLLRERGVGPAALQGWGTSETAREFEDYVCLGFAPPWGMIRKSVHSIIILEIDSGVTLKEGTLFLPDTTARGGMVLSEQRGRDNIESLCDLFVEDEGSRLRNPLSEILVPFRVDWEEVTAILVPGRLSLLRRLKLRRWRKPIGTIKIPR